MQRIENAIEKAIKLRSHGIFISETFELARRQAKRALENGIAPFPIAVKDCFLTQGTPTTCASQMLETYTPPVSATIVDRIVRNGGCIIGKTNLDEFCMGTSSALGHFGPVKSGLGESSSDDWTSPGGSSGGSAVAVQTGIVDIALGSDTGGSTRNPAAFNGIFGLKPTYGVLSRQGLIPLVNSLDAPSILANSAEGCWKALEMMKGRDSGDSTSVDLPNKGNRRNSLEGLRIGVPKEYHNELLSSDSWRVWNHSVNVLKRNGAQIVQISLPHTKYSLACYSVIAAADVASNMARYDSVAYGHRSSRDQSTYEMYAASRSESLNTTVRRRIFAGNYFLMKQIRQNYYDRALKVRRIINDELIGAFEKVDVIVTPSASGTAPKFSQLQNSLFTIEDHDDYFTQSANLAGIPAISIPAGNGSVTKLPIGVQLFANRLDDQLICDVGAILHSKIE
ncbi:unnamed protein product [Caenorhabditis bovis]|uniref:Glutamyl-tRNA(Gln) amidotransferase subunit A, mitochondrial n=1 Tax=Caenorhabditis bovis TaxID=2654633 RepID=A0A8S1F6C3_9PELO|nr:unnamed protein product [Caenorhabditis bovis]